jgi:hypothetical protein
MKALKATGNYQRKKAEVVKPHHEDLFWEKGLLGDHNSKVLLDTTLHWAFLAIRGKNIIVCDIILPSVVVLSQ